MRRDNCLLVKNVVTTSLEKMLIEKVRRGSMLTRCIHCGKQIMRECIALCTASRFVAVLNMVAIRCMMRRS